MNTPLTLTDAFGHTVVLSPKIAASHIELREAERGRFRVNAYLLPPAMERRWEDEVQLEYDTQEGADQAVQELRVFLIDRFLEG